MQEIQIERAPEALRLAASVDVKDTTRDSRQ